MFHVLCNRTILNCHSLRRHFSRFTIKHNFKFNTISKRLLSDNAQKIIPKSERIIGWWFLGCSGMVAGAILLGGITRLTESGLSMVKWKIVSGMRPPRSQKEWEDEFSSYKQYPEYKLLHNDFTLSDFKRIFYMEYAHRMWGRAVGVIFFLPAGYFWARGYFNRGLKIRSIIFGTLIVSQGLLGWYMVKSGLKEIAKTDTNSVPRVSQYRLASHLGLAVFLYSLFFFNALNRLIPSLQSQPFTTSIMKRLKVLNKTTHGVTSLAFLTLVSGAFVAGLDAGLVYNTFPKMSDKWIPDDILAFKPTHKNFFENPTTVQFVHRVLGLTTMFAMLGVWSLTRPTSIPKNVKLAANCLAGVSLAQVTLGISALLMYVPTYLAAMHQSGAITLFSVSMWLMYEIRRVIK